MCSISEKWAIFAMRLRLPLNEHGGMTHAYMPQDQIQEIGQQWAEAELRGDADAIGTLLDADFVCVGPLGFVLDKQQYLAGRRSGDLKQQAFTLEDVRVRVYDDAAVAVGVQT